MNLQKYSIIKTTIINNTVLWEIEDFAQAKMYDKLLKSKNAYRKIVMIYLLNGLL